MMRGGSELVFTETTIVASSIYEAEYVAMSFTSKEVIWLKQLL